MTSLRVDRCLHDKAMNAIDHALGRPLDPMAETYRNHYAAPAAMAATFAASPHWEIGRPMPGGLVPCRVTDAGRAALRDHLEAIRDPHRAFVITFEGHELVQVSTSHAKAKYGCWLDLADCRPDPTFGDFCRAATVRLSKRGRR